jgi:hypothetical protein
MCGENLPKKQYLRIKSISMGTGYIDTLKNASIIIEDLFDGCPVGDGYELTIIEMTEKEFEDLPEFEGF